MNSCSSTDVGTWIGDDEISFGENHRVQVLAGLTFLSNVVVATDEQRMALQEFLRHADHARWAPTAKHLQLRRLTVVSWLRCLLGARSAEEYLNSNVLSTNDAHCAQAGRRRRAGARRRRSLEGYPGQAVRVGEIRARVPVGMISRFRTRTEAWTAVFRGADDDRVIAAAKKGAPTSWCAQRSKNKLASFSLKKPGSEKASSACL